MSGEAIIIPLAGIALPMLLVPTIMAFRQMAKKREYQHIERMKALETGRPIPGESYMPQAFVCAAVGAGVPVGSFLFTFLAWVSTHNPPTEMWVAPMSTSLVALMCCTIMALKMFRPAKGSTTEADANANGKPAFDPDAYDFVGNRG